MLSLQRQLVDEFQSMRSQPTSKQQSKQGRSPSRP